MSELGAPFRKNIINQNEIPICEQKKTTNEKWKSGSNTKLGLEQTMDGLGKPFRKKSDPRNLKK